MAGAAGFTLKMRVLGLLGLLAMLQLGTSVAAVGTAEPNEPEDQRRKLQEIPQMTSTEYQHFLRYPARPLPSKACACRVDINNRVVPRSCPTPWASIAGSSKVPAALKVTADGNLVEAASGKRAKLKGINWFGWETGSANLDGIWAYDDNEIPPTNSVSQESQNKLQFNWWGKRTMTNDFATIVHRIRSLGFNAVRVPFNFINLQQDVPPPKNSPTEFYPCVVDPINYITINMTLDPQLNNIDGKILSAAAPKYSGMKHPPPVIKDDDNMCQRPWEVPFATGYNSAKQYGDKLKLTMCNWYLPQGPNVQQVHRFLWQIQYLVAQGFYVLIDHASYLERDPNMANPTLFSANWGNLWRMVTELPGYDQKLRGRVFPDLANEPSRWGCQWERNCMDNQGQLACAPGIRLYHEAMKAIHRWDGQAIVFANPMGQAGVDAGKFPDCARSYRGMNYGEGTITDRNILQQTGISDPSPFFKNMPSQSKGKVVLTPHVYPGTLSGWGESTQVRSELFPRMDLSYGFKALGWDRTSDGAPLARLPVVVGEFGVYDHGSFYSQGPDYTNIRGVDVTFLNDFGDYLKQKETQGATISWFWWAWNANSGDTKGIAGPDKSWKYIQFTKVRLLVQAYGLNPWYCKAAPSACGDQSNSAVPKPSTALRKVKPGKAVKPKPAAAGKTTRPQAVAKPIAKSTPTQPKPPSPQNFTIPFTGILNSITRAISSIGSMFGGLRRPVMS